MGRGIGLRAVGVDSDSVAVGHTALERGAGRAEGRLKSVFHVHTVDRVEGRWWWSEQTASGRAATFTAVAPCTIIDVSCVTINKEDGGH